MYKEFHYPNQRGKKMKSKLFAFGAALLLMLEGCGGGGGPKKSKLNPLH